jgi:hypothetical protein
MSYIKLSRLDGLVWNVNGVDINDVDASDYLLSSTIDKENEIKSIVSRIDFRYHKHFIIFGLKNLEIIKQIYRQKTPFSSMIIIEIIEENSNEIYIEGEEEDLYFLTDKTVSLVLGCENEIGRQLDIIFRDSYKLYNLRNIEILSMPYVKSLYETEFTNIFHSIFEKLRACIVSFGNDVEDILIGMDNYLSNWNHVFRGVDCKVFENAYKGKPCIIVGAGPSLDKNISELKSIDSKALVFSVDGAINTLLNNNVVPDVVSSIERVDMTAKFYENKKIPEDIIYVGPNVVLGSILEKFSRIVFTGRDGDWLFKEFNENLGFSNLDIGINVSNVLISFARYLGCYPIILVGMDLAYTNGKTHTKSFSADFDDDFMDNYKKNTVYVRGQNGEMLESFEHFIHTKAWIESKIASDRKALYINSTEGGANISGAENKKLSDVISTYCVGEPICKLKVLYDSEKKENTYDKEVLTDKALTFFNNLDEYYNKIIKETQNCYDKLIGSKKSHRIELHEQLRHSLDQTLRDNPAGSFIVQAVTISYRRDIQSFPMVLDKRHENLLCERSLTYYKTLNSVCNKVKENIDLYKQVLKSHIAKDKGEK